MHVIKRTIFILSIFIFGLLLIGCQQDKQNSNNESAALHIYTTIYPIQFLLKEIGGETVAVTTVYPPGIDAHTYEPTSRDMTKIATSDAFIFFGPSMEGFVQSAASALEGETVKLVSIEERAELFGEGEFFDEMTEEDDHHSTDDDHHHDNDPHVWIDPLRMVKMAKMIKEELILLEPTLENLYEQNTINLIERLEKLDHDFSEKMEKKQQKYIIVPHAAYGYWTERYGIEQIAVSGLSTAEEPSQKYLTEIITKAKEYDLKYVFYEQNTPDKLIEIIKEQIGANTVAIHNLSVLTETDINDQADYFSLMEKNISTLDAVLE